MNSSRGLLVPLASCDALLEQTSQWNWANIEPDISIMLPYESFDVKITFSAHILVRVCVS